MEEGSDSFRKVGVHPDPKVAAKVGEEIGREAEAPVEVEVEAEAEAEDLVAGLAQVNPGPSRELGLGLRS